MVHEHTCPKCGEDYQCDFPPCATTIPTEVIRCERCFEEEGPMPMRCLACNAVIETDPSYYRGKSPVCSQACAATKEVHPAHRPLTHTKGPFVIGGELISQEGTDVEVASVWGHHSARRYSPLQPEADANASLIRRFHEVPHTCTDPTCPGMVNKRKLEAYEGLLEAAKEGRDFISTLLGNNTTEATDLLTNHGEDVENKLNAAIANGMGLCACGSDGGEDITTCAECGKPLPEAEGRETA